MNKVVPLEELADSGGVLVHGCFDLLHPGHVRYIMKARALAHHDEMVIATLTSDAHFPKYKNRIVPAFPEDVRAECLAALWMVNYVAIVHEPTAVEAIDIIKPRIYFKGWEAKGIIPHEQAATERNGGTVVYMDKESEEGQIYSSGKILSGEYLRSRQDAARLQRWPFPVDPSKKVCLEVLNHPPNAICDGIHNYVNLRPRGVGDGDFGVE